MTETINLDEIGQSISNEHGVSIISIKSKRQDHKTVKARQAISRKAIELGATYSDVARWMNKCHTTIMGHLGERNNG